MIEHEGYLMKDVSAHISMNAPDEADAVIWSAENVHKGDSVYMTEDDMRAVVSRVLSRKLPKSPNRVPTYFVQLDIGVDARLTQELADLYVLLANAAYSVLEASTANRRNNQERVKGMKEEAKGYMDDCRPHFHLIDWKP